MRKTRSQTAANSAPKPQNGKSGASTQMQTSPNLSEINEIKEMLAYFRVFELQRLLLLLTGSNSKHNTRKIDLQGRIIELLDQNFKVVAPKIRDIYKLSCADGNLVTPGDSGAPAAKRIMYQPQIQLPVQDVRTAALVGNNVVVPFSTNMTSGYPIHPDVSLRKLAFYDVLATLIQPSTLVPANTQRLQEAAFFFTLTPQQATDIASNRDIRNGSKVEHTIQVQLRFCLLETSCEQEDCFPPNVIVKVNNKLCPLPNPIPTNRPNVEPKRPPRPVNVTSNVKLSPTVTNSISVSWCPDFTRGYVVSAFLVRKLTSLQLLNRMKQKGIKAADYTRALIKEKLNEDADCEIATTMLRVSLICPLGKMRMTIPCRASTCSHLQCFDASLFLQMNERKPTWNCPVCDKPAVYETLVIDGYFQEVLASAMLSTDDNEIQLHKDGSWSTHSLRNDTQVLDTPHKPSQKIEVISDDLEVITDEPEDDKPIAKPVVAPIGISAAGIPTTLPGAAVTGNANNEPTSTTNSDTVDLTLSDSDDDLPLRRRAAPKPANNNVGNGQKAANTIKAKQNDSIISLDSPSPPSSPSGLANENGGGSNSAVASPEMRTGMETQSDATVQKSNLSEVMSQEQVNTDMDSSMESLTIIEIVDNPTLVEESPKETAPNSVAISEMNIQTESEVIVRKSMDTFDGRFTSYILMSKDREELDFQKFFSDIRSKVLDIIAKGIEKWIALKVDVILFAVYMKKNYFDNEALINVKSFQSNIYSIDWGTDTGGVYAAIVESLIINTEELNVVDSGWTLVKICHLELNLNKYQPLRGSSYIPLPTDIQLKKACVNVQNTDVYCFKWALISAFRYKFVKRKNTSTASAYKIKNIADTNISLTEEKITLNFEGLQFPLSLESLRKFEEQNEEISINVFGLEKHDGSHHIIGPYYFTRREKSNHINLIILHNHSRTNSHYAWIKNLSRLVGSQLSKSNNKIYFCNSCLQYSQLEEKYGNHKGECSKIISQLPTEENATEEFRLYKRKLTVPFVIYADFQYILTDIGEKPSTSPSSDTSLREHVPCAAAYFVKCSFDRSHDRLRTFYGKDCIDEFMQDLVSHTKHLFKNVLKINRKYLPLTKEERKHQSKSPICYICNKELSLIDRNTSYCHLTGRYMGPVHYECSMIYTLPKKFPIFFHNLTDLDLHLLIRHLDKFSGSVEVRPLNKTKYMSVIKKIHFDDSNGTFQLRFLDSYRFINSDLRNLGINLSEKDLETIKTVFSDPCKFIQRKGLFPYEYINSWDRLDETSLPSQDAFDNKLSGRECSTGDYDFAKTVWTHFNCLTLNDYTVIYLRNNLLHLAAVFENFRNICIESYDLDPAQYYTAPEYTWQAMLKMTNIKLELFTDIDMYNFVKAGIRGDLTQCAHHHAIANNKYMTDYDPSKESQFILYLKANNLYSWAMTQYLPYSNFEWNENLDMNFGDVPDDSDIGYILEVDLEYPCDLHDEHSDLPFCPITTTTPLSNKRLVSNLNSKLKYIIHYKNLQQCLKYGLKLKKIYRILQFKQSAWLKPFIEKNMEHRECAINQFEMYVHETINKGLYAMISENAENSKYVKIARVWESNLRTLGARALINMPHLHSITHFKENLSFAQINQAKVIYNEPIYFGFSVLELSKFKMYEFHYRYMKPKYEKELTLNYFDKDSFIYTIKTNDFYADIKEDIPLYFDTSDYSIRNPYNFSPLNDDALGFMKDENNGQIILEFVGLGPNAFSCKTDNDKKPERPKIILDMVTLSPYIYGLINNFEYCTNMNRIINLHEIYRRALK